MSHASIRRYVTFARNDAISSSIKQIIVSTVGVISKNSGVACFSVQAVYKDDEKNLFQE